MRLIDADALKAVLRKRIDVINRHISCCEDAYSANIQRGRQTGYEIVLDDIAMADTIEAEHVRHGKWEERKWEDARADSGLHTIASARCSECRLWCEQVRDWTARIEYKFCPSCGARMDGDKNAAD